MKKIITLIIIILIVIPLGGCLKRDELENVTIYTTSYPIEYLTSILYGYNSDIKSIYPDGIDIKTYNLTSKQIKDYSKSSIFVYNGLTDEKQIAKNFVNKNNKIHIIDVSYGLKYDISVEELWLSPNYYLMLSANIKNSLQDFITNKYIKEEIDANYVIKLEEPLSLMDAGLHNLGEISKAENRNTIIASSNVFKFLENYGFNVITLDDEDNLTPNNLTNLKNDFKNGIYSHVFVRSDETVNELITDLKETYNAEIIVYNIMENLTDSQRKSNETYFTLMQENIENLKKVTIGK